MTKTFRSLAKFFKSNYKLAVIYMFLATLVPAVLGTFCYEYAISYEKETIFKDLSQENSLINQNLQNFKKHTASFINLFEKVYITSEHKNISNKNNNLTLLLEHYSQYSSNINEISFIRKDGAELYKTLKGKNVQSENLANIYGTSLMHQLLKIKTKEIVIMPTQLATKNGLVVKPFVFTRDWARAIYNNKNQIIGYILVKFVHNQNFNKLFTAKFEDKLEKQLLNSDGYYIFNIAEYKIYGNLIHTRDKYNLSKENPFLWAQITTKQNGFVTQGHKTYVWDRIYYKDTNNNWLLRIIIIPDSYVRGQVSNFIDWIFLAIVIYELLLLIFFTPILRYYLSEYNNYFNLKMAEVAFEGTVPLVVLDLNYKMIKANKALSMLSGYKNIEIINNEPLEFFSNHLANGEKLGEIAQIVATTKSWSNEIVINTKHNAQIPVIYQIRTVTDRHEKPIYYIASFIDIRRQKQTETRLVNLSERDILTQSYNRLVYEREIQRIWSELCDKKIENAYLAILDLDYFKNINDKYGHQFGDKVLVDICQVISKRLRSGDIFARIGGEEFAIIFPNTSAGQAKNALDDLLNIVRDIKFIQYPHLKVTISIGGASLLTSRSPEISFKLADDALYQAKADGRNRANLLD